MSDVQVGQIYEDADPRMLGRRLKVVRVFGKQARLEILTNSEDVQALLDDPTPGTRNFVPEDRRGKISVISQARLTGGEDYRLVEDAPEPEGDTPDH